MTPARQTDIGANASRSLEARRIVNRRLEAERGDWTNARRGHEPADLRIITGQLPNLTVEIVDLLFDSMARLEQRPDRGDQLGTTLNQLLGSHGEDIELGAADDETEVLEQAADLVLEITLDLDQQRTARQQRPDRVAVEILDAHLLKPAGLHDAGDAGRIVAVTLVDLHLEHRLGRGHLREMHGDSLIRCTSHSGHRARRVDQVDTAAWSTSRECGLQSTADCAAGRSVDYLTFYLSSAWHVWRIAQAGDVIVAKTDPPLLSVPMAIIAKMKGADLVNWLQDIFPEVAEALNVGGALGRLATAVLRPVRNWSLRSAKVNVVVGEGMAARLQELGLPPEKIKVISNWADSALISPLPPEESALRKEWIHGRPLRGGLRRQSRPCARHRHGARGDGLAAGAREKVALRSRGEGHVRVCRRRRATRQP